MFKFQTRKSSSFIILAVIGILSLGSVGIASAQRDRDGEAKDFAKFEGRIKHERNSAACDVAADADSAHCHARVVTDANGTPRAATLPSGYGPKEFHAAYGASAFADGKRIIAIVDAYDHPNIQSDLNQYSATFGIPSLPACKVAVASSPTPCFQKVSQAGTTRYPQQNAGWALEIALDVEAAHAMCQNCSILLVEANTASYADLLAAEDRAAILGANVISNSWGSSEFSSETASAYDAHFNKPGIAITVSAGDAGYGAEYPAASRYVTAVGGTSLLFNADGTYGGEAAWAGTGSGCSAYVAKPTWQHDTLCANRTISDVSAVADPSTGAAVYSSVRVSGQRGWFVVGGTSLASPLVASMYALAGGTAGANTPYANATASNLHDVLSGSNGSCGGSYLCTALLGYDGPTGLGTPNGASAF